MILEDLPTPTELLQQFADSVVANMDARSVTGFETTLREMREYHRLLLGLYATTDDDGNPASYAMLDEGWGPLHRSWLSTYRGVIGRAVSKLDEEPEYFGAVSYLSYGLLAIEDRLAPPLVRAILDLGPLAIYRLEEWFTKRAAAIGAERSPDRGVTLIGSDRSVHEDAIIRFIGAWESTARTRNTLGRAIDQADGEPGWRELQACWPGVCGHLEDTASFFVAAAWNQDTVGVERFADLLLRWLSNLHFEGNTSAFARPWLVNGDVMALDWEAAQVALAAQLRPDPWEELTPRSVFAAVIGNLHAHVVLITASVTLNWVLSGKGAGFALDAARRLLNGVLVDPEQHMRRPDGERTGFLDRLRQLVALELAGKRHEKETYGALLDAIASTLDRISEKKMTSGRTYTPSTIHDRRDLSRALDLILLTSVRGGASRAGLQVLSDLVEVEANLPDNAAALRDLIGLMTRLRQTTASVGEPTYLMLQALDANVDAVVAVEEGAAFAAQSLSYFDELRTERIAQRSVAAGRIALLENGIHSKLVEGSGEIPLFAGFTISLSSDPIIAERQHIITNVPKSEFVDPPIDTWSSNFMEVYSDLSAELLIRPIWAEFLQLPKRQVRLRSAPDTTRFWQTVVRRSNDMGEPAVLVMSRAAYRGFADRFLMGGRREERPLEIVRKREFDRSTYRQTVDGVDVHEVSFSNRSEAYLMRANMLRQVEYRVLENNLAVAASFEDVRRSPWKGRLTLRFAPRYSWRDGEIIHLEFPARTRQRT